MWGVCLIMRIDDFLIKGGVMNSKACCKSRGLCPLSFGLALGITSGLAVLIWMIVIMYGFMPTPPFIHEPLTWGHGFIYALWGLLKGFVFGFVLALIYDLILCCKGKSCKCCKEGACSSSEQPEEKKS